MYVLTLPALAAAVAISAGTMENEVKAAIWAVEPESEEAAPALCGGGTTQLIIGDRWAERPPTMNFQTDEGGERASERRKEGRPKNGEAGRGKARLSLWLADHPQREQNFRCSLAATAAWHLAAASLPSLLWAFTLHFTASCRFIFRPTDPTTSSSIENAAVASLPRRQDHTRSSGK